MDDTLCTVYMQSNYFLEIRNYIYRNVLFLLKALQILTKY